VEVLAAEREQLAQALAASSDAVMVVGADGSELLRNEAAERFRDGRHGDALANEAIKELLAQAMRGIASERELQIFGPPPEVLRLWSVPLIVRGVLSGAVAFVRDVTEARRVESVRRDFVANVSHELKTPIGALALLAETMAAGGDEALLQQLAERMAREADRVARIVDDLLDLSHIEAQEAPLREPVPVALIVSEAIERVRSVADAREIRLDVSEIPAELTIVCDRGQLVSAMSNLIDNAVKYSDPGSSVGIGSVEYDDLVVVEVRDQGIGIPSRDLERIFERFYRVDRARSRATGGTGLGLSIVRHIAQAHGGDVMVESREGVGSEFRLRIPADSATMSMPLTEEGVSDG
jgi:two-component system sensor histidine kinase SenX3